MIDKTIFTLDTIPSTMEEDWNTSSKLATENIKLVQ